MASFFNPTSHDLLYGQYTKWFQMWVQPKQHNLEMKYILTIGDSSVSLIVLQGIYLLIEKKKIAHFINV